MVVPGDSAEGPPFNVQSGHPLPEPWDQTIGTQAPVYPYPRNMCFMVLGLRSKSACRCLASGSQIGNRWYHLLHPFATGKNVCSICSYMAGWWFGTGFFPPTHTYIYIYIVLYCMVWYGIALYCIVLYCIVLYLLIYVFIYLSISICWE